jgi:hypothetical protein
MAAGGGGARHLAAGRGGRGGNLAGYHVGKTGSFIDGLTLEG